MAHSTLFRTCVFQGASGQLRMQGNRQSTRRAVGEVAGGCQGAARETESRQRSQGGQGTSRGTCLCWAELGCSLGSPSVQDVYGTTHLQHKRCPSCPQHNIVYASVAGAGVGVEVNKAAGWRWTGCGGLCVCVPTYSQHTVNIQSTYSQHPVNIQSTSPVFILLLLSISCRKRRVRDGSFKIFNIFYNFKCTQYAKT